MLLRRHRKNEAEEYEVLNNEGEAYEVLNNKGEHVKTFIIKDKTKEKSTTRRGGKKPSS